MNETYLCPYSQADARRLGESSLWEASFQANVSCARDIEAAIRDYSSTDGSLRPEASQGILDRWGFRRTIFVLASTLRNAAPGYDQFLSEENRQWQKNAYIPDDGIHNRYFAVDTAGASLDAFVGQVREAYGRLELFGPEQCEPHSQAELDYQGKVLVLSPDTLKESCWSPRNQLWYAHDGSGCSPAAPGRSIRCTCLGDGETACWNRTEFVGVLKEEFLPEWAQDRLAALGLRPAPIGRAALEARLKERVTAEWASCQARLEAMPAKELIAQAEAISARRFCFGQLTENACLYPTDLLAYLDSLETPLQDLSERWAAWQEGGSMEELERAIVSLQEEQREARAGGPVQRGGAGLEMR